MAIEDFKETPFQKIKGSITLKVFTIGFLILILLIPSSMVRSLIYEREERQNSTINEINAKWGNSQMITGPILSIPYKTYKFVDDKKVSTGISYAQFLPEELIINGKINPEIRYRGIFEAILYNTNLNISGKFTFPDFDEWDIADDDILLYDAYITLGITDMRGIKEDIILNWDEMQITPEPGIKVKELSESIISGISVPIQIVGDKNQKKSFSFNTVLDINGSGQLDFIPLGKKTTVTLQSEWGNPSFLGAFLPESREITKNGFKANWKIFNYNRNYPQKWHEGSYLFHQSAFGVNLLLPVDEYQKTERTTKYAILFISLTFLAFFIIEILTKKRLHPVQYLLIGFALCLFYTLLLSLTEHIGFGIAYLCASAGVVLLISGYCKSVIKSTPLSILVGGLISILYAFLFVILQLQDYALLMGSVGLFVILAIVMFITRKIDWYNIGKKEQS